MKQVTLSYSKTRDRSNSFSVSIGYEGALVFNEGTYYPALDDLEEQELDYYITVAAIHKAQVFVLLLQHCTASGVDCEQFNTTQTTSDEQLLGVLQLLYNRGHFRSLDAVEQWLKMQKISFNKTNWFAIG